MTQILEIERTPRRVLRGRIVVFRGERFVELRIWSARDGGPFKRDSHRGLLVRPTELEPIASALRTAAATLETLEPEDVTSAKQRTPERQREDLAAQIVAALDAAPAPSQRALARRLGRSHVTTGRALRMLEAQGTVVRAQGRICLRACAGDTA